MTPIMKLVDPCLVVGQCKSPPRKPAIHIRRRLGSKKLLLGTKLPIRDPGLSFKQEALLVKLPDSDPGLSPSTRLLSPKPTSPCSGIIRSPQRKNPYRLHRDKMTSNLVELSDALAFELADLQSGKERWAEDLNLLKARLSQSSTQIEQWVIESKCKVVSVLAAESRVLISNNEKVAFEGDSISAQPGWKLSLTDLMSIFRGDKEDQGNKEMNTTFFSSQEEPILPGKLQDEHENRIKRPNKGKAELLKEERGDQWIGPATPRLEYNQTLKETQQYALMLEGDGHVLETAPVAFLEDNMQHAQQEVNALKVMLSDCKMALENLKLEKTDLENRLHNCQWALEETQENAKTSEHKNVTLEEDLSYYRKMVEETLQSTLALQSEKCDAENELIQCKRSLDEVRRNASTLKRANAALETEIKDCKHHLEMSERTAVAWRREKVVLEGELSKCKEVLVATQQHVIELEGDNSKLRMVSDELKQRLEKTQLDFLVVEEKKSDVEAALNESNKMLRENRETAARDREDLEVALNQTNLTLHKCQQHALIIERQKGVLETELAECRWALGETQRHVLTLQGDNCTLETALAESEEALKEALKLSKQTLGECQEHVLTIQKEKVSLETMLAECRQALEETHQHLVTMQNEQLSLERSLAESKEALTEAWKHTSCLEEHNSALEIAQGVANQALEEKEQHLSTLESTLDGTLDRADALDRQLQRLRNENKRLNQTIEDFETERSEQEAKIKDLEFARSKLQDEVIKMEGNKDAAEASLAKGSTFYASVVEEVKQQKQAIQALEGRESHYKEEIQQCKSLLGGYMQHFTKLENENDEVHARLVEIDLQLHSSVQIHANEVEALKSEIGTLVEQVQYKDHELWRSREHEVEQEAQMTVLESKLQMALRDLECVKTELTCKVVELENEKLEKEAVIRDMELKEEIFSMLEEESIIKADQGGPRVALAERLTKETILLEHFKGDGMAVWGQERFSNEDPLQDLNTIEEPGSELEKGAVEKANNDLTLPMKSLNFPKEVARCRKLEDAGLAMSEGMHEEDTELLAWGEGEVQVWRADLEEHLELLREDAKETNGDVNSELEEQQVWSTELESDTGVHSGEERIPVRQRLQVEQWQIMELSHECETLRAKQGAVQADGLGKKDEEFRRLKERVDFLRHSLSTAQQTVIAQELELGSLKHLLLHKKGTTNSSILPTAALSTSALAALGFVAFLKCPKNYI